MHHRLLVIFDRKHATSSRQARGYVFETLHNEHFCCGEGRWADGIADWFVIGGRFSGELSRHSWAKFITNEMRALEQEHGLQVWGCFYGRDEEKNKKQAELAKQFQAMWDCAAPEQYKGIPYQRDTYQEHGYEDDAMMLTAELYLGLLAPYEGSNESEENVDLDYEEVTPSMVDKKWLVVVDYHS